MQAEYSSWYTVCVAISRPAHTPTYPSFPCNVCTPPTNICLQLKVDVNVTTLHPLYFYISLYVCMYVYAFFGFCISLYIAMITVLQETIKLYYYYYYFKAVLPNALFTFFFNVFGLGNVEKYKFQNENSMKRNSFQIAFLNYFNNLTI